MKKSKIVTLHYYETKQNNKTKRQYKITLPAKLIDILHWKPGDRLKAFINKKHNIELRKQ